MRIVWPFCRWVWLFLVLVLAVNAVTAGELVAALDELPRLTPGKTKAENALWLENPLSARFNQSKQVVVADLKGPAVVTMLHFAMPETLKLNRDVLLRMFWDGERSPSVEVPLVDFFCDPAGLSEQVNTAMVNKRRGFNAYFPMPFRRSARLELLYDGPEPPGEKLWKIMPCYSYVMYRTLNKVPRGTGYFHASWRQEGLLLGTRDYVALEARGKGKFVGWNVTVRRPGRDNYPVDENEKFFIDGASTAAIEFQGLEDSFGFSWGFPETENQFPLTGYFKFLKGAAAYRFFAQDSISFEKSLRVAIGFGVNEDASFKREFSKRGSTLQLSSTVYWYQLEPHSPLPPMPAAAQRAPAPEQPFWPEKETLPSESELRARGVKLEMFCGRPDKEVLFAAEGYAAATKHGAAFSGWNLPVYYACAADDEVEIELTVPKNCSGVVRLYIIDPDNFQGGRKEKLLVGGDDLGTFEKFQEGKWVEHPVTSAQTAEGKISIQAINARQGANAVLSMVEWVER